MIMSTTCVGDVCKERRTEICWHQSKMLKWQAQYPEVVQTCALTTGGYESYLVHVLFLMLAPPVGKSAKDGFRQGNGANRQTTFRIFFGSALYGYKRYMLHAHTSMSPYRILYGWI